jgi:diguanylate cyclase (GGDEF)-like protein/PAS domain S-box-containing protein
MMATGSTPWHQRLHAALMPDYNRAATVVWWGCVLLGYALLIGALLVFADRPASAWGQLAAGTALAMVMGLFPLRIPRIKSSFVASEVFLFLVLLMLGPAAAVVAASAEAAVGTWRSSKRWTSRIGSPAMAAIAMSVAGAVLQWLLAQPLPAAYGAVAPLIVVMTLSAVLYFFFSVTLVAGVLRLKRGEAYLQPLQTISTFRWVGIAYAGSASIAALLYFAYREAGVNVLLVMVPLLVLLLVALHFYFRQQEAHEAVRDAGIEAALAAERHLLALQSSERRFHSAFEHAAIGMALLQFDGRILQANPALAGLLGRDASVLQQAPLHTLAAEDDRDALANLLGLAALPGLPRQGDFESFARELRFRRSDGAVVWLALHCSFFTEPDAQTPCLILQAQDVTARRSAEAGLQHMAYHDALTGLPNRRRFMECLSGAVARNLADPASAYAVLFLDFDRFKLVNDSLGHRAGDELLVQLARRIQEKLRPHDIVARLGGDEYAVLIDRLANERDAVTLAERLMQGLQQPFHIGDTEIVATASVGITFSSFGYTQADDVLRDADIAMYEAKGSGKARYALFDSRLHTQVSQRLRMEGQLRQAVAREEISVAYQPLFDLAPGRQGRLTGFEALLRWRRADGSQVGPASFVPLAEEAGLMVSLSDFVLHCACHQLRQWQLSDVSRAELTMSVNISASDLMQGDFVARVSRAIVEAGLRPEHLTLELTENILMSRIEGATQTLVALRRLGVRIAVDDFGTGYSSLSHLAKLPVDSLKIDRSFVSQLARGSDEEAVVRAIVQLGTSLRKAIVAEGIETQAQGDLLLEMGCTTGQGFHLAAPQSGAVMSEWLALQGGPVH